MLLINKFFKENFKPLKFIMVYVNIRIEIDNKIKKIKILSLKKNFVIFILKKNYILRFF